MKKSVFLLLLLSFFVSLFAGFSSSELFERASREQDNKKIQTLLALSENFSDSLYGQKALLELGKIYFLQRKYEKSIEFLRKIYFSEIGEKEFWLAKSYLKNGENRKAIISAQNFISASDDFTKIEESFFIIAEAYIQDKLFAKALHTLETLRTSKYIENHIPLLHYKIGFCYENLKKNQDAIRSYQKLINDFPYTQYSYLAQDRIYNLQKENEVSEPEEQIASETNKTTKTTDKYYPETKISLGEYQTYLQVGAFSSNKNALNFKKKIIQLGFEAIIFSKIKNGKKLFVVAAGPFPDGKKLKEATDRLRKNNISFFVIKR